MLAFLKLAGFALPSLALAWDYTKNGNDWSELGECAGGGVFSAQSPIDLPESAAPDAAKRMFLKYPHLGQPVKLYNNGYSIAMTMPETYRAGFGLAADEAELTASDVTEVYRLWQVNFHSPSEHTLNGKRFPLEMQMMHMSVNNEKRLAAVSVLFDGSGSTNKFIERLSDRGIPEKAWDEVVINQGSAPASDHNTQSFGLDLDFGSVVEGAGFFTYEGSLTVPPCETQVKYFVRQTPVAATVMQLAEIERVLRRTAPPSGNFRAMPIGSTAADNVQSVESVNTITGTAGETVAEKASAASGSEAVNEVQHIAEMNELQADDSPELREAKTEYQQAQLNAESAEVANDSARRNLDSANALYDGAQGNVAKINQRWNVIAAEQAANGATVASINAHKALERAALHANEVYHSEHGLAPVQSAPETALGTDFHLNYQPSVELQRGPGANPFRDQAAHTQVTISAYGGLVPTKIAPNLQQPDGSPGQVAVPGRISSSFVRQQPVRPTIPPQPMQVVVDLPIDLNNVANQTQLRVDLADAVAAQEGISRSRVSVPELVPISMPGAIAAEEISAGPAGAPAAALLSDNRGRIRGSHRH